MRAFHFVLGAFLSTLAPTTTASPASHKPIQSYSAQAVVQKLNLTTNIEGGYYAQTFQDRATCHNRSDSSLIYYLLEGSAGPSRWHRVIDATEVWHFYAGAPLRLDLSHDNGTRTRHHVLGPDIFDGQAPQFVIPRGEWQRAQSLGKWTLVGTTVAPAFSAANGSYQVSDVGWEPKSA